MPGRLGHNKQYTDWARAERIYRPQNELNRIRVACQAHRMCLLSWYPGLVGKTHAQVAAGNADAELERLKDDLDLVTGSEVFYIAINHEPENQDNYVDPAVYVPSMRRFVNRVVAPLSNARSALCMIREAYGIGDQVTSQMEHDPGEQYVDMYAGDPYNPWKLEPEYQFRELEWLATPMVRYAESRNRPVGVWETGCQEDSRKPQWILNAGTFAKEAQIKVLSFFYGTGPRASWDIESTTASRAAITKLSNRTYFEERERPRTVE